MTSREATRVSDDPSPGLDLVAWLLLAVLVVVGLRPLIQETVDTAAQPFGSVLTEVTATRPTCTLWIDLLVVALFGATQTLGLAGLLPRPRPTGLYPGLLVLGVAAAVSCAVAGNRRLAMGATLDWLTLPLLAITLAQLAQRTWHLRLGIAVVVAAGCANAAECLDYRLVMHADTVAHYEDVRAELWASRGIDLDSSSVALYEKRVYDPAASGFFAFSNIAGSYFLLALAAAATVAVSARGWAARALPLACAGLLITGLWLTRSRGAMAAAMLGLVLGAGTFALGRWISLRPRTAWAAGWTLVVAVAAACVGLGLSRGHLPGGSLTYRWWYLEATARMIADHPLIGVGSAQFGRHYPRYKEIKSPEEIANPHNFLAHSAAEWGLPGLAGVMLMMFGGSWVLSGARRRPAGVAQPRGPTAQGPGLPLAAGLILGLTALVFALRALVIGHSDVNYIVATNLFPLLGWLVAAGLFIVRPSDPLPHALPLLGLGLMVFLIHNLISFSLFVPGSATTFFAVLGLCFAARGHTDLPAAGPRSSGAPRRRAAALAALATAVVVPALFWFVVRPVGRSWPHLEAARSMQLAAMGAGGDAALWARAADRLDAARRCDPVDPTPIAELLELPRSLTLSPVDLRALESELIARDPENPAVYRRMAATRLRRGALEDAERAGRLYEDVLVRYPSSPDDHLHAAEIHERIQQLGGASQHLRRAVHEIETALQLDAERDLREVRRFGPQRIAALRSRLDLLQQRLDAEQAE